MSDSQVHGSLLARYLQSIAAHVDSGLLITLGLCLFSWWPLLYRPGLPNGDDVLYHVYRAAEMDRAWSHGVLMPQWAETFYTGYGAPLFHYYASLTYYTTSIFMRLFALDAVNSLRLLIAMCMLASGAGMYAFVRRYAGGAGGIIAALCYVYSPYILFTEPYSRGAYPELMAFALFPALMWSYQRLMSNDQAARSKAATFGLAAVLEGALIITHNLMALVMTGLLAAWIVWSLLVRASSAQRRETEVRSSYPGNRMRRIRLHLLALLAVTLGVGLAAYFWIPVASEGYAVKLSNLTGLAELNYRNFFVPIFHLLEPNPRPDAGALNGLEHRLNLGVPQWTLALAGVAGIGIVRTFSRIHRRSLANSQQPIANSANALSLSTILFFSLAACSLLILILSASLRVWQLVAPLAYLQFPWRLLGPAVFCLSMLAGMNAVWLERLPRLIGGLLVAGVVVLVIGMAAPTLYVTEWTHATVETSVAAYQDAELKGLQRATTFSNEYLPSTVAVEPGPTPRLLADYADGYPVNKAHLEVLPPGVTVEVLDHGPQHDVWRVHAPAPFTMEVLTYDFPGWTAEIDGQTVPIAPSDPHGLITFPIPAGDHTVRVFLGSTPPRDLGNAVTALSAVIILAACWTMYRSRTMRNQESFQHLPHASSLIPFLLGGLVTLAFLLVYMREGGAWVNSPPGEALLAQDQMTYHVGAQIEFIGYDLSSREFRPGDRLELVVYWYAREQPRYGYNSFVHIANGGPPVAQADKRNPAGLPTVLWTPDGYIGDEYVIDLPDTIQPGEYQLLVGLWTCDNAPEGECGTGRPAVTDAQGNVVGDAVPLGTIMVR